MKLLKTVHKLTFSALRVNFSLFLSLADETVKIFIGNLTATATETKLEALFAPYGEVVECDILKKYGFVVS